MSAFLDLFEDPADTPDPTRSETREERLERKRKEKAEANEYKLEQVSLLLFNVYGKYDVQNCLNT